MLPLARIPQPRIGSFRFHGDGTISLTNRPFTTVLALMEAEGARRILQSGDTYTCTEPYVSAMLTFHDHGSCAIRTPPFAKGTASSAWV